MNGLHKLYLVEGIWGTGKTTTSYHLKEQLEYTGRRVKLYTEGMLHPADMALQAYLTMSEYFDLLYNAESIWKISNRTVTKEEIVECITTQSRIEEDHAIVAYTKINFPEPCFYSLYDDLAAREVYDGRLCLKEFKALHLKRFKNFCKWALDSTNTSFIFECAFLQNPITELMGFYDLDDDYILAYLTELLSTIMPLNPKLIYIEPDSIEACLRQTASIRIDNHPEGPSWMDQMISYIENTNYGKLHNLYGFDGLVNFLENRLRLEKLTLNTLPITCERRIRTFS